MRLNLGCGSQVVDGWINVDYSLGARMTKIPGFAALNRHLRLFDLRWDPRVELHDLRRTFPWNSNSAAVVYSSHTLEHMTREEGRRFLQECLRVLTPGGTIRILVPDLSLLVMDYVRRATRAEDFLEGIGVLFGTGKLGWKRRLAPFIEFPHLCMYDWQALFRILSDIGFVGVTQRAGFDSAIAQIEVIELKERTDRALIVEGNKG